MITHKITELVEVTFLIDADNVDEELRLKYRYIDLRRPVMRDRLLMRHKMIMAMRTLMTC
jgi:aspartyl-tRNA synthetase